MATRDLWRQVGPQLQSLGGQWWRLEAMVPDGVADVIGIVGGRTIFVELKDDGDQLRRSQRLFLHQAITAGAEAWIVRRRHGVIELVEVVAEDLREAGHVQLPITALAKITQPCPQARSLPLRPMRRKGRKADGGSHRDGVG